MRLAALLPSIFIAACTSGGDALPEQDSSAVAAAFVAAIDGCTAGIAQDGTIDQQALSGAGWSVIQRNTRRGTTTLDRKVDDYPALRNDEDEASTWHRPGVDQNLELIRSGGDSLASYCSISGRTDDAGIHAVRNAINRKIGAASARDGVVPQGGDWLTPRKHQDAAGHYWPMPANDVYLTVYDNNSMRLEILAMPDRDGLDQFSPDRPENRIIKVEHAL